MQNYCKENNCTVLIIMALIHIALLGRNKTLLYLQKIHSLLVERSLFR